MIEEVSVVSKRFIKNIQHSATAAEGIDLHVSNHGYFEACDNSLSLTSISVGLIKGIGPGRLIINLLPRYKATRHTVAEILLV